MKSESGFVKVFQQNKDDFELTTPEIYKVEIFFVKNCFVRKRSNAKKEYRQNNEGEFVSLNPDSLFSQASARSFFFY
jgi:hypothetical protein